MPISSPGSGGGTTTYTAPFTGAISRTISDRLSDQISILDFGAIPDIEGADGAVTSGTTAFTSASAAFVSGDVGKQIWIEHAGPSSKQIHHTTIAAFVSATSITLTNAANHTAANARYGYGVDNTLAIQAALDYQGTGVAAKGVDVYVPRGSFYTNGLTIRYNSHLHGAGRGSSALRLNPARNEPLLQNEFSAGVFNAGFITIADLFLDGNRGRQTTSGTALGACHGIQFQANGVGAGAQDRDSDPHLLVRDVWIFNCKGVGVLETGASEGRIVNVQVEYADEYGFWPSFDTNLLQCISANAGKAGFYVNNTSVRIIGGKVWFSGGVTASLGFGVQIENVSGGTVTVVGLECQDNKASGLYLNSAKNVNIQISLDSNNNRAGTASQYSDNGQTGDFAAVEMNSCSNCTVVFTAEDRFKWTQVYGLKMTGTNTGNNVTFTNTVNNTPPAAAFTSATNASPPVVTTAAEHGLVTGNVVQFTSVTGTGAAAWTGNYFRVTRVSTTTFNVLNLDGTSASAPGGTITGGNYALIPRPIAPSSTATGMAQNTILPNNMLGSQNVAFASSITPDFTNGSYIIVGALTGAMTVNLPLPPYWAGAQMTFQFVQDGTGSRVVTWNSGYKTIATPVSASASKTSVVNFTYDGSSWIQGGSVVGI